MLGGVKTTAGWVKKLEDAKLLSHWLQGEARDRRDSVKVERKAKGDRGGRGLMHCDQCKAQTMLTRASRTVTVSSLDLLEVPGLC